MSHHVRFMHGAVAGKIDDSKGLGCILAIAFVVCVILPLGSGVVWLLLQLFWACALPIAGGLVTFAAFFYGMLAAAPRRTAPDQVDTSQLARVLELDAVQMAWTYKASRARPDPDLRSVGHWGCFVSLVIGLGLLVIFFDRGWLGNIRWRSLWFFGHGTLPSWLSLVLGAALSSAAWGLASIWLVRRRAAAGVEHMAREAADIMNSEAARTVVQELAQAVEQQAREMGVTAFDTGICGFCAEANRQRRDVIADPARFGRALQDVLVQLQTDLEALRNASRRYEQAKAYYSSVHAAIQRTGNQRLAQQLEHVSRELEPGKLHQLLAARRWKEYAGTLDRAMAALESLHNTTREGAERWHESSTDRLLPPHMPLAHAYEILGVSPTATVDQIRRRYRRLARQMHPDVNREADATLRMTEVNAAWETVKRERGFS